MILESATTHRARRCTHKRQSHRFARPDSEKKLFCGYEFPGTRGLRIQCGNLKIAIATPPLLVNVNWFIFKSCYIYEKMAQAFEAGFLESALIYEHRGRAPFQMASPYQGRMVRTELIAHSSRCMVGPIEPCARGIKRARAK